MARRQLTVARGRVAPHAGKTISLQFERHRRAAGASRRSAKPARLDAGQVLYVMAEFVRNHVRLGEIARRTESLRQLVEKSEVEIDAAIAGAIERSGCRLREATRRFDGVSEQHHSRSLVPPAKDVCPAVLHVVCDGVHKIHETFFGGRRVYRPRCPHALTRRRIATSEERKKILPGENTEKQQNDKPADADRHHAAAGPAAHVFDIAAIPRFPLHG